MAEAEVGANEDIERAIRRFKRQVKDEGIIKDVRAREFYEKPSEVKKKIKDRNKKNRDRQEED